MNSNAGSSLLLCFTVATAILCRFCVHSHATATVASSSRSWMLLPRHPCRYNSLSHWSRLPFPSLLGYGSPSSPSCKGRSALALSKLPPLKLTVPQPSLARAVPPRPLLRPPPSLEHRLQQPPLARPPLVCCAHVARSHRPSPAWLRPFAGAPCHRTATQPRPRHHRSSSLAPVSR